MKTRQYALSGLLLAGAGASSLFIYLRNVEAGMHFSYCAIGVIFIALGVVYDLIAGLMTSDLLTNNFVKLLLQTMPTPNLTFFLNAPEGVVSVRRGIPIGVVREKYLLLASALDSSILNTSNDFTKNQQKVRKRLFLYL